MLRLLLLSLGLIVVTSCPKPPPTMPPKQPTPAPDDIGKLAPPAVTRRPKFGDAVHLDLGGRTGEQGRASCGCRSGRAVSGVDGSVEAAGFDDARADHARR